MDINEIVPYPNNPRKNEKAVKEVKQSIIECGYNDLIEVDENNVILSGHTRLKALKGLKYKQVEVIKITGLNELQKKKYRILANKTGEIAEWDFDLLSFEVADLDFSNFGFDFDYLKLDLAVAEDDNFDVDQALSEDPISQLGDMWQLGRHKLICADSTILDNVTKLMDGVKADLYLSDPPYNVAYEGKTKDKLKIKNDSMSSESFKDFLVKAFFAFKENLKAGGSYYIFHADSEGHNFRLACIENKLLVKQCLIWNKNVMVMGRQDYHWKHEPILYGWKDGASHFWANDRKQTTILNFDRPSRNQEHPTMKPVEILAYLIKNNTKEEDIVLDTFGGSGSTLITCEQINRICYMAELDPKYADVIIKRWEKYSGQKAVKLN